MDLKVLKSDDPFLHEPCYPVTLKELKTKKMQGIIEKMLDYVYGNSNKGKNRISSKPMTVGLSANQVGINKRITIIDLAIGRKLYNDIHVLINPEITLHSKAIVKSTEGCVNLPHIWGKVRRYKKITVNALDRSGNKIILELEGWPAILLQHEIGHLNGELFIDRLENPHKAHFVTDKDYSEYKRSKGFWNKFTDVSMLVKPLHSV